MWHYLEVKTQTQNNNNKKNPPKTKNQNKTPIKNQQTNKLQSPQSRFEIGNWVWSLAKGWGLFKSFQITVKLENLQLFPHKANKDRMIDMYMDSKFNSITYAK